jgi:hypothetical protein
MSNIPLLCAAVLGNVTLQKYFSHPSLVIYFFATPPKKTELGTANRWGTTNSKPPGLIIMIGQSETLSSSQIIFITLFSPGAQPWCACYLATGNLCHYAEPKSFSWAKLAYFDFFSSNFHMQGQILSTTGDSLRGKLWIWVMLSRRVFGYLHIHFLVCQWVLRTLLCIFEDEDLF